MAEAVERAPNGTIAGYNQVWRKVRLKLVLLQQGAAQNIEPQRSSSGPYKSGRPGDGFPELDHLDRRWANCRTNEQRWQVIIDAVRLHTAWQIGPPQERIKGTEAWRKAVATDPRPKRVVAMRYGISTSTVARLRRTGGKA